MIYTLEDLRKGKCAVINDGTLHQIKTVLDYCFPNNNDYLWYNDDYFKKMYYCVSKRVTIWGSLKLSGVMTKNEVKAQEIPVQSVIDFYNQI